MLTHNLYYLDLCRTSILRPRVVVLGRGDSAGDPIAFPLALPITRRRFVEFNAASCKVVVR
jgi:hypothetical protein